MYFEIIVMKQILCKELWIIINVPNYTVKPFELYFNHGKPEILISLDPISSGILNNVKRLQEENWYNSFFFCTQELHY